MAFRSDSSSSSPSPRRSVIVSVGLGMIGVFTVLLMTTDTMNTLAQMDGWASAMLVRVAEPATALSEPTAADDDPVVQGYRFLDHPHHPERLLNLPAPPPIVRKARHASNEALEAWHQLLQTYRTRQGVDDNFTIRVIDNRDGTVLERHRVQIDPGTAWPAVDRERRRATRSLVDAYERRGIPRDAITVKWGRANQVQQARVRETPFIEFEVRLAERLGLSLLVTEIGTVETFNNDRMVSRVGARSRYQLMPFHLRARNIQQYDLRTAQGGTIKVREHWHPLFTMEPAFELVRGYANAVGHELPGLSAYHTGPNNIYRVLTQFLRNQRPSAQDHVTVVDAFMWGLTDGFPIVSENTSFRTYSRGYVPALIGSLEATHHLPIDTTQTFEGVRVQLASDASLPLADLLDATREAWTPYGSDAYATFRLFNPHLDLPEPLSSGRVPADGNVILTASADGASVRFFVPTRAPLLLETRRGALLDMEQIKTYDRSTFAEPHPGEVTEWDVAYRDLVESTKHFGFSRERRAELIDLAERFKRMAALNPTPYRLQQLNIIKTHRQAWGTRQWRQLTASTEAMRATFRAPVRPPTVQAPRLQVPPLVAAPLTSEAGI